MEDANQVVLRGNRARDVAAVHAVGQLAHHLGAERPHAADHAVVPGDERLVRRPFLPLKEERLQPLFRTHEQKLAAQPHVRRGVLDALQVRVAHHRFKLLQREVDVVVGRAVVEIDGTVRRIQHRQHALDGVKVGGFSWQHEDVGVKVVLAV